MLCAWLGCYGVKSSQVNAVTILPIRIQKWILETVITPVSLIDPNQFVALLLKNNGGDAHLRFWCDRIGDTVTIL